MGLVTNIVAYAPTLKHVCLLHLYFIAEDDSSVVSTSCSGSKGCGTETSSDDEPLVVSRKEGKGEVEVEEGKGV